MAHKPLVYLTGASSLDEEILHCLKIPYVVEGAGQDPACGASAYDVALGSLAEHVSQERMRVAGLLLPATWATQGARVAAATSGMGSLVSCADLLATVESIPGLYGYYSLADAWAEAVAYMRIYGTERQREALSHLGGVKVHTPREYAPGVIAGLVAAQAGPLDVAETPLGAGIAHKVGVDHHHLENPHWAVEPEGEGVGLLYEGEVILSWRVIRGFSLAACARVAFSTPVDTELIHTFTKGTRA